MVVRGPLGAGKTTVARALASALGGPVVSIDAILERDVWDGGSEALFLRANAVAAGEARKPLERGLPVIVDGNFYWRRTLDDLAARLPFPHEVFSLKVPLAVCTQRDRGRTLSYGEEATREVFEKVARVDYGVPIDGTLPVARIVREILRHLPVRRAERPPRRTGRRSAPGGPTDRAPLSAQRPTSVSVLRPPRRHRPRA